MKLPSLCLIALPAFVCMLTVSDALAKTKSVKKTSKADTTLVFRGDITAKRDLVDDIAHGWEKMHRGKLTVQAFNTISGIEAVAYGQADLAGSARQADGGMLESKLKFTPVAWDALVLITHPANPVQQLTPKQLRDIYYGQITNWKDVGGPDKSINLYAVASPGDGVEYSLRHLLFGHGDQNVAAPRLYVNTAKLEEAIALDPAALGVSTMAGTSRNTKLKLLAVNGVVPNMSTLTDGSYPLYSAVYVVTNSTSPKTTLAQSFVNYLRSDAAKTTMRNHGVLPYADAANLCTLDEVRRQRLLSEIQSTPTAQLQH